MRWRAGRGEDAKGVWPFQTEQVASTRMRWKGQTVRGRVLLEHEEGRGEREREKEKEKRKRRTAASEQVIILGEGAARAAHLGSCHGAERRHGVVLFYCSGHGVRHH